MQKRPALIVLGWLVAAASAVAIGVVAVSFLGDSMTSASTAALSRLDVAERLERTPEPEPEPSPTSAPGQAPATTTTTTAPTTTAPATQETSGGGTGQPRGIGSVGGQVVASCRDGAAYLESWSPAQGYEVDDVERGPADEASLSFKTGDSSGEGSGESEIEIDVTCKDGLPVAAIENDDRGDDGGDDRDDD